MARLSIGCDARALVGPRTGVGTWTERIAGGLVRTGVATVRLAATAPVELADDERHPGIEIVPAPRWPTLGPVWLNTQVPRLARAVDVWLGSLAILPLRCPSPTVSVVHDLTPMTHPHRHTLANRLVYRLLLEPSLRSADAVVAVSEATAKLVRTTCPWVEDKLEVIGNGVDEFYSPAPDGAAGTDVRRRFARGRRYVLHLGTVEPRKGLPTLVAAWEALSGERDEVPDLVIAGRSGWQVEPILRRIRSSPRADRIHLTGYVTRSDARELLRHASVFVLASEAEGFGLPLAEAISCGTPAVASDIPALREVGGDAALYCRPNEPEALTVTLASALEPATAGRLRERALRRAPQLRWQPVIAAWTELLRRVAEE
jgi:glycosyltransferase involved in cell wall biosynthesis